jgi:hypothetical protein
MNYIYIYIYYIYVYITIYSYPIYRFFPYEYPMIRGFFWCRFVDAAQLGAAGSSSVPDTAPWVRGNGPWWVEEILHHLGWLKAYEQWDKPPVDGWLIQLFLGFQPSQVV